MVSRFRKRDWAIVFLLVLLLVITLFVGFVYTADCKDRDCLIKAMFECKKTYFESEQKNVTWQYTVKGLSDSNCVVSVKAVNVQLSPSLAKTIEGQAMNCNIPKSLAGSFLPESKLEYCHGLLKEALQDMIIEKMHLYIMQNIGQFNQSAV